MKKLIFILLVFLASYAYAEPFLVCDPQVGVTQYKIVWAGGATEYISADVDGALHYDAVGLSQGDSSGDLFAGKAWGVDGDPQEAFEWSDPRPFVLTKPSASAIPTNLRLQTQ